ncbi:hypothetical protein [Kribbella sp. NPDC003557]|uniref:hypothetical protein n=1 Tax=Kribbella sp. NPDC003557 TaxID=3154449 RepID=UPI00339EE5B7
MTRTAARAAAADPSVDFDTTDGVLDARTGRHLLDVRRAVHAALLKLVSEPGADPRPARLLSG